MCGNLGQLIPINQIEISMNHENYTQWSTRRLENDWTKMNGNVTIVDIL